jgi:3'-phosphoadenosine 5'-phosphosulfate (PAPS) 3'-phosphatase
LHGQSLNARQDKVVDVIRDVLGFFAALFRLALLLYLPPADLGGAAGGAEGRHWVLDPIDGTRGFVGQRQYAVCLGMLQQGEVVLGVLGCPNLPVGPVSDDDGKAGEARGWGRMYPSLKQSRIWYCLL